MRKWGEGSRRGTQRTFIDGVDPTEPVSLIEIFVIIPVNVFRQLPVESSICASNSVDTFARW